MFRNLIFDWSGTLVDDLGPVIEATNEVLLAYGLAPLDREGFRRRFRLPYREFYQELLPDVAMEELEAKFRPAFDQAKTPVTVLPHAREKLDWCRLCGVRMFVLTSMDPLAFERQLDGFGLRAYFEATYSGIADKREVIHQIIAEYALKPDDTAFVGDMTHDVETAHHAGIASIAVLTGYNHAEVLATARPDMTVPDLAVLRRLLGRKMAPSDPVSSVEGLVHNDRGQVLLFRSEPAGFAWGFPGGRIQHGEAANHALQRHLRDQLQLEIHDPRFVMVQDCIASPNSPHANHFVMLCYLASVTAWQDPHTDLGGHFEWMTARDALSLDLTETARVFLFEALEKGLLSP